MNKIVKEIFKKANLISFEKLLDYGFEVIDDKYVYQTSFLNDSFYFYFEIDKNKNIDSKIIDKELDEEYDSIFIETLEGGYVSKVREMYKKLLIKIKDDLFNETTFISPQANRIKSLIQYKYNELPDFPFKDDHITGIFRYPDNRKWYGLIMNITKYKVTKKEEDIEHVDVFNIKVAEERIPSIFNEKSIYPSYHMKKTSWVSIILDDTLDDNYIMELVDESRNYAINSTKKNKIKWIFFDIGSTLLDETECEIYRFKETIKNTNITYDEWVKEYIELYKQNKPAYNIMIKKYNLKKIPWPSHLEYEFEGVKEVLAYMKKHFHLGIIANQRLGTIERLKKRDMDKYFDVIISSAEERLEKPDPRIFNLALERAGINSSEAVMIGDRLDNDILPSMELGFKTIWIRKSYGAYGNPNLLPKKIDYIIDDIRDLYKIDLKELKKR